MTDTTSIPTAGRLPDHPAGQLLLDVRDLTVEFPGRAEADGQPGAPLRAVAGISFSIEPGRTLCLVGESGCGKSMTALALLRLVPEPGRIAAGSVRLEGRDLLPLPEQDMRGVRGRSISMIFQEPMTSLNPVFRVGEQIAEGLRLHLGLSRSQAAARAVDLLRQVGIPSPELRARDFPHQMSGGMRQRVMIAMALACDPRLLIADEPTTALDVTIQRQILRLMRDLAARRGAAVLLITHDLGVVAETADHVAVMYAGRIMEYAPVGEFFARPLHPYAQGLMRSVPQAVSGPRAERLSAIPGTVPPLWALPSGCTFRDRCPHAFARCAEQEPPLLAVPPEVEPSAMAAPHPDGAAPAHGVRCWLHAPSAPDTPKAP
ncbi:ABC transporter ATP-binding protein [Nitratidesulfovibrio sp. D1]|uniref:ABC transporter ATP-binding protein n=1 Tax=Nitratidesulfovibrio sp. D1 TaxID=3440151 RepID=UPI003EC11925